MMPSRPPTGIGVSMETYREFLKQRYDLTEKMCCKLADFLGTAFGFQGEADDFTMALSALLNLETSRELEEIEKMPDPPAVPAPALGSDESMTEALMQCVEKVERLREQVAKLRAGIERTPPEMQTGIEAMCMYLENEQRSAEQQRDWIQKQMEARQPKGANAE